MVKFHFIPINLAFIWKYCGGTTGCFVFTQDLCFSDCPGDLFNLSMYVGRICVWTCTHECRCPRRPETLDPPGARATGNCEPPDMDAGNGTWVLCKSSICPNPWVLYFLWLPRQKTRKLSFLIFKKDNNFSVPVHLKTEWDDWGALAWEGLCLWTVALCVYITICWWKVVLSQPGHSGCALKNCFIP